VKGLGENKSKEYFDTEDTIYSMYLMELLKKRIHKVY
jgi:hypothetical protein